MRKFFKSYVHPVALSGGLFIRGKAGRGMNTVGVGGAP